VGASSDGQTRKPRGGQEGNSNNLRHGYYSLVTTLKKGHLDRRTLLGRYQMEQEKELSDALGGDPSPQERVLIRDTVRTMLYLGSIDAYLIGLKSAIRRGKLHPIIKERVRLAAHVRENLRALGLKRVARDAESLESYVKRTYGGRDDNEAQDRKDGEQDNG
jgi:hypothetical protein